MLAPSIDVVLNPAEIRLLPEADLSGSVCVVFDVLRATSSMVTALAHGAAAIVPADSPGRARAAARRLPGCLLAGERNRLKIPGFDLANSPPDFASPAVRGRTLVMATTNGTRAIGACRRARAVYVAALLNLGATARALEGALRAGGRRVRLVCAGTEAEFSWEDCLAAGRLVDLLRRRGPRVELSDSALAALASYRMRRRGLRRALAEGKNGRVLAGLGLSRDIAWCARLDAYRVACRLEAGRVVRVRGRRP